MWALHALWLVAEAAGPAFMRHAATTLDLTLNLLLSEDAATPGLPQAAQRIVNSLVAALGPELKPGNKLFTRCKFNRIE